MNKSLVLVIVSFVSGAVGGATIAHILARRSYEAQIASVKEHFTVPRHYPMPETPKAIEENSEPEEKLISEKPPLVEYAKIAQGYISQKADAPKMETALKEDIPEEKEAELIHVIPPSQFGLQYGWETFTLKYYANHILVDEDERVIEDPADIIGPTALNTFGLYEPDCVYVVNEDGECYYEVLAVDEDYELGDAYAK